MRFLIVLAALAVAASSAAVKRDAPAKDLDVTKLFEDMKTKLEDLKSKVLDQTQLDGMVQNATATMTTAVANMEKQMKDAAPELKAHLEKITGDVKDTMKKIKESSPTIADYSTNLEKMFEKVKNDDNVQKFSSIVEQMFKDTQNMLNSVKDQVVKAGN